MFLYDAYRPQYYAMYAQDKTSYYYLHFIGADLEAVLRELGVLEKTVFSVRGEAVKAIFLKLLSVYGATDPLSVLKSERYVNELISALAERMSIHPTNIIKGKGSNRKAIKKVSIISPAVAVSL